MEQVNEGQYNPNEMTGEEHEKKQKENAELQAQFQATTQAMGKEFDDICEKYNITFIASIHFNDQNVSGVQAYGKQNNVETLGLAKLVEQKYIQ